MFEGAMISLGKRLNVYSCTVSKIANDFDVIQMQILIGSRRHVLWLFA